MAKSHLASLVALAFVAGAFVATGCGAAGDWPADGSLRIVATTGMVADLAERVGGGRVSVRALMGPGIDPHLYKASEGDLRRLEAADVILYNGLHLEAKMADVLAEIGESGRHTRAVAEAIPRRRLIRVSETQVDPHVWFDVTLWMHALRAVEDALVEADPAHAALYRANAAAYERELEALDAWVLREVARVPRERRVLVTAHDAFGYFGARYGFEVRGLQGISTVAEAGARDVAELADFIVERRIPVIFVETSVSPRTIEAVRAAVDARGFEVAIGESLFSDAMGDPGTPEGTYPGMVRHNVRAIVSGLLGEGVSEARASTTAR
ncbi:MAG: zinc ABC transporter substrate-binding protein [Thermoleophilia bacterium]|nr:zinc ABC transporter substrate-binding protein [Gaiellaceae bacterium]MDW8337706.1 zinc ABC transporter substrate-binding protein [Thermoleophilia bacterium]